MNGITNQDQYRRTVQALNETFRLIMKEVSYRAEFQKKDYLASLNQHAEKLTSWIEQWESRKA